MRNARLLLVGLGIVALLAAYGPSASAQAPEPVAGTKTLAIGVTVTQLTDVIKGWSVKKKVLGQDVYNDKSEKVGKIEDLILGADKASSFAIVAAGGFLGIDTHDVAIPIKQFQEKDGKFVLPGATKEAVKAMPEFQYAK
jgi:sporulation protein YlmC with PRC-barrel domain